MSVEETHLHDKSSVRRSTEQRLIRWAALACAWLARVLPLRCVQAIGNGVGWLVYHFLRDRRELALRNMRAVLGDSYGERERARALLGATRNMAKTMLELLKFPALSDEELASLVPGPRLEHLDEALARGRGVIVVTPHFGVWEVLPTWGARNGYDITVVVRDPDDPGTANVIRRAREDCGARFIERYQVREMIRVLRDGHILGILPDQNAGQAGMWLDFMGRPASTVTGPAFLALRTGAAIVPGFARRTRDDHVDMYFLPALEPPDTGDREADVVRLTQMINDIMGAEIREHPEQWMWMHNRWRTPPDDLQVPGAADAQPGR